MAPVTPELTLLLREGCHLCEDMEQQLAELLPPGSHSRGVRPRCRLFCGFLSRTPVSPQPHFSLSQVALQSSAKSTCSIATRPLAHEAHATEHP